MKNFFSFFTQINYKSLKNSTSEVLSMTFIAFIPLLINILIYAVAHNSDFILAFKEKIIPGEMLSYSLSFIAPSMYLLVKMQGSNYKLPLAKTFSVITLFIYACSMVLYIIAKNKLSPSIDLNKHEFDLYYNLSLLFVFASILFRIYSIYHGSYSNWTKERKQQQDDFNKTFTANIK